MIVEAVAAALICLDPGHGTPPAFGRQTEPIGPGSRMYKIKDGGGASGEAAVALAIAKKTRTLLLRRGYRVAMTRTGPVFRYGTGGNVARAQFCNRRHAALMLRIHADGSTDSSRTGVATLYPSLSPRLDRRHLRASLRAARLVQRASVAATGAADIGLLRASDLTGSTGRTCRRSSSRPGSCRTLRAAPPAVGPVPVARGARLHRRVAAFTQRGNGVALTGSDPANK